MINSLNILQIKFIPIKLNLFQPKLSLGQGNQNLERLKQSLGQSKPNLGEGNLSYSQLNLSLGQGKLNLGRIE